MPCLKSVLRPLNEKSAEWSEIGAKNSSVGSIANIRDLTCSKKQSLFKVSSENRGAYMRDLSRITQSDSPVAWAALVNL